MRPRARALVALGPAILLGLAPAAPARAATGEGAGAAAPAPAAADPAVPAGPDTGAAPAADEGGAAPAEDRPNGFALTGLLVDREQIVAGGPARDGIRAVDAPVFVPFDEARWIDETTPVLGLVLEGDARAYPIHLMDYHQVVNDVVGGVPVAVTWDPLTGAPIAYRRTVDGRVLHFGVSGLLFNSGFLLYDRETGSLWSQFLGRAIAGELAGRDLERVRLRQENPASWRARQPNTKVLAPPLPDRIDYRFSPFERYMTEDAPSFPVAARDERFHAKELALGVLAPDGRAIAYLGSLLTREGGFAEDRFAGRDLVIEYSSELSVFRWQVPDELEVTEAYWFAWKAFHPETRIWNGPTPEDAEP